MRNRVATVTNWFWVYLTYGGGIRLIIGCDSSEEAGGVMRSRNL
jgi:hypothetical protein